MKRTSFLSTLVLPLVLGLYPTTAHSQVTYPEVKWRQSRPTSVRGDPCWNVDGVPSTVTWSGSDGTSVKVERREFCSHDAALGSLSRRLGRTPGVLDAPIRVPQKPDAGSEGDQPSPREVWAEIPDGTVGPGSQPTLVLHYIVVKGRTSLDVFGSDERHIKLVVEELRRRGDLD